VLAQGRYWRAALSRGRDGVVIAMVREGLPEDAVELFGLEIEVPLARWADVVRQLRPDRKLLGGVLLGFAREEEKLPRAIGNDRLFGELQRVLTEVTLGLIEEGRLRLEPPGPPDGS
jgi:hypothetical protein